jgi:putative oxidoreductase
MATPLPGTSIVPLVGRVLIGLLFIPSGLAKITGFGGTIAYVASAGLPAPALGAAIAAIVELGLGILVLVGWKARWSALIMAVFTIAAALFFHKFWTAPPEQQMLQNIQFFKNMAIAGGLLFVYAFGPGDYSLDAREGRARTDAHRTA